MRDWNHRQLTQAEPLPTLSGVQRHSDCSLSSLRSHFYSPLSPRSTSEQEALLMLRAYSHGFARVEIRMKDWGWVRPTLTELLEKPLGTFNFDERRGRDGGRGGASE